jgi:ubiquinone/menaquinone biosynthesis C-methylase UbiE
MDEAEFDRVADEYYEQHRANIAMTGESPEYFSEYKIKELKRLCELAAVSTSSICDFGSGIGNSTEFFRKHFPNSALTSADVSRRSLEISQLRFRDSVSHLLIEDDHIPVNDNSFDVTFSACVFHHISHEEHLAWLRELHRITRDGGMIAIFEHNPFNPLTVRAVNTCPFDVNAKLIYAHALKTKLLDAGWREPSAEYNLFFPRMLASLRPLEHYLHWLPFGAQYVIHARKV